MNKSGNIIYQIVLFVIVFAFSFSGYSQVNASYSSNVTSGCLPLTVRFTDNSTGSPTQWEWDFGNGNKSTLKDPSAIFFNSGKYTIKLTVKDASNNTSIVQTMVIKVFNNPTANFDANPRTICENDTVKFTNRSVAGDTSISSYAWYFGDGNTTTVQNPNNRYTNSGNYSVSLVIRDLNGCQNSTIKNQFITVNKAPVVDFRTEDPLYCSLPASVKFINQTNPSTDNTYDWNLGNNTNSTQAEPTSTYSSYGTYSIKLSARNKNGCASSITKNISIQPLVASFTLTSSKFCLNQEIAFRNQSTSSSAITYLWSFGDGTTSNDFNPRKIYSKSGTYQVTLKISYKNCEETYVYPTLITIFPKPKLELIVSDSFFCTAPSTGIIYTKGPVNGGTIEVEGDTLYNSIKNRLFYHSFKAYKTYTIKADLIDSNGCKETLIKKVELDRPFAEFNQKDTQGCLPLNISLQNQSRSKYPITNYYWILNSKDTVSRTETHQITFNQVSKNTLQLVIKNTKGCIDSKTIKIDVGTKIKVKFETEKDSVCNREGFTIFNRSDTMYQDQVKWKWDVGKELFFEREAKVSFHKKPDTIDVELISNLNGCYDTLIKENYIKIMAPYVTIIPDITFNPCHPVDSLILKADLTESHRFFWRIDNQLYYDTVVKFYKPIPKNIYIQADNDSTKCFDFEELQYNIPQEYVIAKINKDTLSDCLPQTLTMESLFTSDSYKYTWRVNNQVFSDQSNTSYTINRGGNYYFNLGIEIANVCKDSIGFNHYINDLVINASVKPLGACLPMKVELIDTQYNRFDNYWMIGNKKKIISNQKVIEIDLNDSVEIINNHVEIELFSYNIDSCLMRKKFKVFAGVPDAKIVKAINRQCQYETVLFKAQINDSINKGPFSISWSFSDSSTFNTKEVSRVYLSKQSEKTYLTVSDTFGCKIRLEDNSMFYGSSLVPEFDYDPKRLICPPQEVNFYDLSEALNPISSWKWTFSDGTVSYLKNPIKVFLQAGTFDVKLEIRDNRGCYKVSEKIKFVLIDGPTGQYTFNKKEGCVPLQIAFTGQTPDSSNTFEWDLGNGVLQKEKFFNFSYSKSGRYIPSVVISDTQGCKYVLPPVDTIYVHDYPKPLFEVLSKCVEDTLILKNTSLSNHSDPFCNYKWLDNQKNVLSTEREPKLKFNTLGLNQLILEAENKGMCAKDTLIEFELHKPNAQLKLNKKLLCLGEILNISNASTSKYPIISSTWVVNDSVQTTQSTSINRTFATKGLYDIQISVIDEVGCKDTFVEESFLVGDTIAPIATPQLRVSVENDQTVEVKFLQNKEVDFGKYFIYYESNNQYFKVKNCNQRNDTLHFMSPYQTLRKSHCFKINTENVCFKSLPLDSIKPHCTVETNAKGVVNANIVKWNPYVGWPVKQYDIYRENPERKGDYQYLNTVNGNKTQYIDSSITCLTTYFYRIHAIEQDGYLETSWSDTCAATPIWVNTVAPNEVWRATVENDKNIRLEWVYPNSYKVPLKELIIQKYDPIKNERTYSTQLINDSSHFIDLRVNVHKQSYQYQTKVIDQCNDTSVYGNIGKSILLKASFNEIAQRPALTWNHYKQWNEDVNYYIIERRNSLLEFEKIGMTSTGKDSTFIDYQAPLACNPNYVYRVIAVRNQPLKKDSLWNVVSMSNTSEAKPISKLFMPNAFSPDNNNINEQFGPKGVFIKRYQFTIYNRWGEKLFETFNCLEAWDGTFKGERCMESVYLYRLEALGTDNKHYQLKGTFTLLR